MKKLLFTIMSICALFTACKIDELGNDLERVVFDPGNLKLVSTSLNTNKKTSSALYGNQEALQSLSAENNQPIKGSELKLATWKYHDNPQYIGGTINGELLSVESLSADENGKITYQFKDSSKTENNATNKAERIQYIMSYKPVNRP